MKPITWEEKGRTWAGWAHGLGRALESPSPQPRLWLPHVLLPPVRRPCLSISLPLVDASPCPGQSVTAPRDLETQAQTPGVSLLPGSHPSNTFPASSFFLDETASSSPPTKPPAALPDAPPPRKKSFFNLSVSLLESQHWNRHTLSGEVGPHRTKRDQPQLSPAPPQPAGSESYRGLSRLPELIVKFAGTLQGCF